MVITLTEASTACAWRIAAIGTDDAGADGFGGAGGGVAGAAAGLGAAAGAGAAAAGAAGLAAAGGGGGGGAAAVSVFAAGLSLTAPGLILNNCCPDFTVSPSCTKISSITPLTGVGTPTVVLSVSISITFSSARTSSPTFTVNLRETNTQQHQNNVLGHVTFAFASPVVWHASNRLNANLKHTHTHSLDISFGHRIGEWWHFDNFTQCRRAMNEPQIIIRPSRAAGDPAKNGFGIKLS